MCAAPGVVLGCSGVALGCLWGGDVVLGLFLVVLCGSGVALGGPGVVLGLMWG
jgi:hypothetical protein